MKIIVLIKRLNISCEELPIPGLILTYTIEAMHFVIPVGKPKTYINAGKFTCHSFNLIEISIKLIIK